MAALFVGAVRGNLQFRMLAVQRRAPTKLEFFGGDVSSDHRVGRDAANDRPHVVRLAMPRIAQAAADGVADRLGADSQVPVAVGAGETLPRLKLRLLRLRHLGGDLRGSGRVEILGGGDLVVLDRLFSDDADRLAH